MFYISVWSIRRRTLPNFDVEIWLTFTLSSLSSKNRYSIQIDFFLFKSQFLLEKNDSQKSLLWGKVMEEVGVCSKKARNSGRAQKQQNCRFFRRKKEGARKKDFWFDHKTDILDSNYKTKSFQFFFFNSLVKIAKFFRSN